MAGDETEAGLHHARAPRREGLLAEAHGKIGQRDEALAARAEADARTLREELA